MARLLMVANILQTLEGICRISKGAMVLFCNVMVVWNGTIYSMLRI